MDEHRCPRCGSYDARCTSTEFADVTLLEMSCDACKLYEERRSDARDLAEWRERWRGRPRVPAWDPDDFLVDVD